MELTQLDPESWKVDMTKPAEEYARLQSVLAERELLLRQVNEKKQEVKKVAIVISAEISKLASACSALKKAASMTDEESNALHQMILAQGIASQSAMGYAAAK